VQEKSLHGTLLEASWNLPWGLLIQLLLLEYLCGYRFGNLYSSAQLSIYTYGSRQQQIVMARLEGAPKHGKPAHLLPQTYKRMISEWLEEDTPTFDYGGFVVGDEMAEAKLLGKSAVRSSVLRSTLRFHTNVISRASSQASPSSTRSSTSSTARTLTPSLPPSP